MVKLAHTWPKLAVNRGPLWITRSFKMAFSTETTIKTQTTTKRGEPTFHSWFLKKVWTLLMLMMWPILSKRRPKKNWTRGSKTRRIAIMMLVPEKNGLTRCQRTTISHWQTNSKCTLKLHSGWEPKLLSLCKTEKANRNKARICDLERRLRIVSMFFLWTQRRMLSTKRELKEWRLQR